jgi:hypothetical protein
MLESGSSTRSRKPVARHARLVSSQSFPHLWKKLWKIHQIRDAAELAARVFTDFTRAKAAEAYFLGLPGDEMM